jgi:hypothetical protein
VLTEDGIKMDRTQQHRLTLKFIEVMGLESDHCTATIIDLIVNHKNSHNPIEDLEKAAFYLLRLQEMYREDKQIDIATNPNVKTPSNGTKVLRVYDQLS